MAASRGKGWRTEVEILVSVNPRQYYDADNTEEFLSADYQEVRVNMLRTLRLRTSDWVNLWSAHPKSRLFFLLQSVLDKTGVIGKFGIFNPSVRIAMSGANIGSGAKFDNLLAISFRDIEKTDRNLRRSWNALKRILRNEGIQRLVENPALGDYLRNLAILKENNKEVNFMEGFPNIKDLLTVLAIMLDEIANAAKKAKNYHISMQYIGYGEDGRWRKIKFETGVPPIDVM